MIRVLVFINIYEGGRGSKRDHLSRVVEYAIAPEIDDSLEVLGQEFGADGELNVGSAHLSVVQRWIHLPADSDIPWGEADGKYDVEVHTSIYHTPIAGDFARKLREAGYS